MKKIMTWLLVAVMLVACMATTAFAAERGDTVTVEFAVSGNSDNGFGNLQLTLNYDRSALEFQSVVGTGITTSGGGIITGGDKNGETKVGIISIAGIPGNGAVAKVTFKVSDTAAPGTYPVSGTVTMCREADGVTPVALNVSGGSVTVVCNHNYVAGTAVAPTCEDKGYTPYTCSKCGDTVNKNEVAALGHDMKETAAAVPATCTKDGKTAVKTCANGCGTTEGGAVIPATGHDPATAVIENEVKATCTTKGSYDEVVKCSVCKEELSRTPVTVDALGHTPAAAVIENEVKETCTTAGSYEEVVYCSVCNAEISRTPKTVPATGHKNTEVRDAKDPTCTEKGYTGDTYCKDCNTLIKKGTEIDATGHVNTEIRDAKVATCKTEGYTGDTYCKDCGEKLATGTVTPIDPDNHTPDKAVRENEVKGDCKTKHSYDEVVYCSECKVEISRKNVVGELGGHSYGTDGKCTCCGKVKDPNLDNQPDTGDIFVEIAMYAAFAALAVGAVVAAKRKARG